MNIQHISILSLLASGPGYFCSKVAMMFVAYIVGCHISLYVIFSETLS